MTIVTDVTELVKDLTNHQLAAEAVRFGAQRERCPVLTAPMVAVLHTEAERRHLLVG